MSTPPLGQSPLFSFGTDLDGGEPAAVIPTPEPIPEPEPEPVPSVVEPPPLTSAERARLSELENSQQTLQLQQVQSNIQKEAQERYDEALKWGWSQEQAQQRGEDHLASRNREVQTIVQSMQRQNQQSETAQSRAQIAKEFGITPAELNDFSDAQSMRGHARIVQQLHQMQGQLQRAVPGTPPQTFESSATEQGGTSSDAGILAALGNGTLNPNQLSREETDRMVRDLLS